MTHPHQPLLYQAVLLLAMRRKLILAALALTAGTVVAQSPPGTRVWPSEVPNDCPLKPSGQFAGLGFTGRVVNHGQADTWYPSWGADGRLYSPFTDGNVDRVKADGSVEKVNSWSGGTGAVIGHAVIEGDDVMSLKLIEAGTVAASPAPYGGRYPCACLHYNGVWYLGTYALATAPYGLNWPILGPFAGFHISKDNGKTWTQSPWGCEPGKTMFPEPATFKGPLKLGVPHVVDFGKNMENSPDGKMYLVCHGATQQDEADRQANLSWITGDQIYLCRVTPGPETVNDPAQYEFFGGHDAQGQAVWSKDFSKIQPLVDWNNNCGCVTITYNKPLGKYLMCVTDGRTTESRYNSYILESERITGPWKMVTYMKDFGTEAYFVNIPSKFISHDGLSFWLCYSANWKNVADGKLVHPANPPESSYTLSMHEVRLLDAAEAKALPMMPAPDAPATAKP
jgi:hypothetical protein